MNKLSKEDFELWRLNPVTEMLFAYLDQKVAEADQLWARRLSDPMGARDDLFAYQIDLAARVDMMKQMRELAHEDLSNEPNTSNVTSITDARGRR